MVLARASIFEPALEQLQRRLHECNIPFWPHGFVTAHCDIEALLQNWTNEYACLGYGEDLYPALVNFCELTGSKNHFSVIGRKALSVGGDHEFNIITGTN